MNPKYERQDEDCPRLRVIASSCEQNSETRTALTHQGVAFDWEAKQEKEPLEFQVRDQIL